MPSESPPPSPGSGRTPDTEARRLRWRCRRGLKELDVLLERFALERLGSASGDERRELAALLALPDPVLAEYLLGEGMPSDARLAQLVAGIKALCRRGARVAVFSG
jgi:antitoxin CptB